MGLRHHNPTPQGAAMVAVASCGDEGVEGVRQWGDDGDGGRLDMVTDVDGSDRSVMEDGNGGSGAFARKFF
nr:hypothetical protein [Tanacetum cinerariifolium]